MPRADELPHALPILQKKKKRDELVGKGLFAKQPVHAGQHLPRLGPGMEFHAESAQHHGTQQGGGHSLAGNVGQDPHPISRSQLQEIVEISSHIARGSVIRVDAVILKLRQATGQQAFLSLLRQG